MADSTSSDTVMQTIMLDAVTEGLGAAIFVYDRNDLLCYASQSVLQFFPVPRGMLQNGTRLRDFLGAVYDSGIRFAIGASADRMGGRDGWISAQIAGHWKERNDQIERFGQDRWIRFIKRRMPSGFGVCVIKDVSEEKKREDQWRLDLERVQLTEEILETLPFPVSVKDKGLNYAAVNRAMSKLLGREPEKIIGRNDRELLAPELATMFELSDRRALDNGGLLAYPEQIKGFGEGRPFMTYKWRVGKPGRSFLVTVPQDLKANDSVDLRGLTIMGAGANAAAGQAYATDQACSGERVLLVTGNPVLEKQALETLSHLGFDSCAVHDETELEAFLTMAIESGIHVDLIVVDSQMEVVCLELADRFGVMSLPLDAYQIANQLAVAVAHALNSVGNDYTTSNTSRGEVVELALPSAGEWQHEGLDVLVAEDNEVNQIVLSQIMESLGYVYAIAGTGAETLHLWQEKHPRVILLDTTLPDMSGEDVIREIRLHEQAGQTRVPVIGVLARAMEGDREACRHAGMDDTLLKPLSPDMVGNAIRRFLSDAQAVQVKGQ